MRIINSKILNRKKVIIALGVIFVLIFLIVLFSLYIAKRDVRDWVDIHLLGKNISEKDVSTINLNTDKTNQIHVYGKYIALLNDKAVTLYNSYGEKVTSIDVNINTAIFDSSSKYLAIAEKGGKEITLLLDKNYLWSATCEGDILQIHVNQNGYAAVVSTDVNHKSIVTLYNSSGKKLFTSYFASTRIVDASISHDNKYIAIGELDSSVAVIASKVKVISVDNAQNDPENTIINTYDIESERLITNVEYQAGGQIVCVYDNGASVIKNGENKEIIKIENDNITHISNNFKNNLIYIEEQSEGLFKVSSNIHIINTSNGQDTIYKLDDISKGIYTNENVMAINVGTDMYFINTGGWLIKKYTANQEISNVKMSESLAVIIYRDKIEIVDF